MRRRSLFFTDGIMPSGFFTPARKKLGAAFSESVSQVMSLAGNAIAAKQSRRTISDSLSLSQSATNSLVVADPHRIIVANTARDEMRIFHTDGSSGAVFSSAVHNPRFMCRNPANGDIYYNSDDDSGRGGIRKISGDGLTDTQILASDNIGGLVCDWTNSHIYYTENSQSHIRRMSLTGTGDTLIYNQASGILQGIDLYSGNLYWAQRTSTASIKRVSTAGSGATALVSGGSLNGSPFGICVDGANSRIFWTEIDGASPRVVKSTLAGGSVTAIKTGLVQPLGVVYDPTTNKVIYCESFSGTNRALRAMNDDGSSQTTLYQLDPGGTGPSGADPHGVLVY